MKQLSIIIPAFNAEKYVTRCLKSVIECVNIDDFEIIFIDDGSTDRTKELAEQFICDTQTDKLIILSQDNSRQGAARNKGLSIARGEYVMFLDVDDFLNPVDYNGLLQLCDNNKLDIINYSFKVFDKSGNYRIKSESQFDNNKVYSGFDVLLMNYTIGSVCGAIYNREFFTRANIQFREDIVHEDTDFMLKLLPKAQRIMFSPLCAYTYCWNEGSTDRSNLTENLIKSIKSDIVIAKSYIETAIAYSSSPINSFYHKKGNSQMVSILYNLIFGYNFLPLTLRYEIIKYAKNKNVYPMKDMGTLSLKSTILQFFLNNEFLMKTLIKIFNL